MGIHGQPWKSMVDHGNPWWTMKIHVFYLAFSTLLYNFFDAFNDFFEGVDDSFQDFNIYFEEFGAVSMVHIQISLISLVCIEISTYAMDHFNKRPLQQRTAWTKDRLNRRLLKQKTVWTKDHLNKRPLEQKTAWTECFTFRRSGKPLVSCCTGNE